MQGRLDSQKQLLRSCDKDISERVQEQQTLHKKVNQAQLQVQETEHRLSKMSKDSRDAARQVQHMGARVMWGGAVSFTPLLCFLFLFYFFKSSVMWWCSDFVSVLI